LDLVASEAIPELIVDRSVCRYELGSCEDDGGKKGKKLVQVSSHLKVKKSESCNRDTVNVAVYLYVSKLA